MIGDARKRIQGAVMRRLLVVLGLVLGSVASIAGASAQEYEIPTLRGADSWVPDAPGPLYRPRWSGFYVGGQLGYGAGTFDFSQTTHGLIAHQLRETQLESEQHPSNWSVLGQTSTRSASAGGFVGYNIGWECLAVGFELNYSASSFSSSGPVSPIARVVAVGTNIDTVVLTGSGSMNITDYGTLRARAGYIVNNFMPFFMIGAAFGRADVARSATATVTQTPADGSAPGTTFVFSEAEAKRAYIYGWSIGGGLEVMVMPHVFLRAEYEYIAFVPVLEIRAQVQTARVGLGYKF
jgi:outer membrane immunogenic protein